MMLKPFRSSMVFPLFLLLTGCGGGEQDEPIKQSTGEHVWKDQTQALDKAKQVDQLIQDAEDKRRKAMEQQGG